MGIQSGVRITIVYVFIAAFRPGVGLWSIVPSKSDFNFLLHEVYSWVDVRRLRVLFLRVIFFKFMGEFLWLIFVLGRFVRNLGRKSGGSFWCSWCSVLACLLRRLLFYLQAFQCKYHNFHVVGVQVLHHSILFF